MEAARKKFCWSFAPRDAYATVYNGVPMGIGLLPVWEAVPGAWNIFVLTSELIDTLLPWGAKDPGQFPVTTVALPAVIGTALQPVDDNGLWTIGHLAETSRPLQFLEAIKHRNDLFLMLAFGEAWWTVACERAAVLERTIGSNIVHVDFSKDVAGMAVQ